jgi:hypothetical protein
MEVDDNAFLRNWNTASHGGSSDDESHNHALADEDFDDASVSDEDNDHADRWATRGPGAASVSSDDDDAASSTSFSAFGASDSDDDGESLEAFYQHAPPAAARSYVSETRALRTPTQRTVRKPDRQVAAASIDDIWQHDCCSHCCKRFFRFQDVSGFPRFVVRTLRVCFTGHCSDFDFSKLQIAELRQMFWSRNEIQRSQYLLDYILTHVKQNPRNLHSTVNKKEKKKKNLTFQMWPATPAPTPHCLHRSTHQNSGFRFSFLFAFRPAVACSACVTARSSCLRSLFFFFFFCLLN